MRDAEVPIRTDKPVPRLTTKGPFRYTRNPGYLALAAIYSGIAFLRSSLWAMLLLPLVLTVIPSTKNGTLIPLPLTQRDLAALVGASRVRVNQAIAFFKKRRYLSVGTDRRITIHDVDALARRAR